MLPALAFDSNALSAFFKIAITVFRRIGSFSCDPLGYCARKLYISPVLNLGKLTHIIHSFWLTMLCGSGKLFKIKKITEPEVKIGGSRKFEYIKLEKNGGRYFCLQQKLPVLAWMLFFKKDTLLPICRSESKRLSLRLLIGSFRGKYRLLRKNLIFLIIFARYKYQLRRIDSVLHLPFYGQICVPVHKGYKIFDIRRGVVVKVFDSDVATSAINKEIEQLKKISKIDFAPSLKSWNIEERWFEESFYSGSLDSSHNPMDSETVLTKFCQKLVPYIHTLMLFQPPRSIKALEHVEKTLEILEVSRSSRKEPKFEEFKKIENFLESIVDRLRTEGNCSVFLTMTHGDFCPANMLNTRCGMKVIDWEGVEDRSVLFDLYSYFFYRPVSRKVPVAIVASEINDALPFFLSSVSKKAPEIFDSLSKLGRVYRLVYYVEHISKEVEREMTDKNLNMMESILGYIDVFNSYEDILEVKY